MKQNELTTVINWLISNRYMVIEPKDKMELIETLINDLESKKTSSEWYSSIYPQNDLSIIDANGWNKSNYKYSFFEERISLEEFQNRISNSTCMILDPMKEYVSVSA